MGVKRGGYRLSEAELAARTGRDAAVTARWGDRVRCPPGPPFQAFRRDVKAVAPEMWGDILSLRRRIHDRRRHARAAKNPPAAAARAAARAVDAALLHEWGDLVDCAPGGEYTALRSAVKTSGAPPHVWDDLKALRRRIRTRAALERFRARAVPPLPEPPAPDAAPTTLCPHCGATGFIDLN